MADYKDLPSTGNREREAAAEKKSHIDRSKPAKKSAPKKKNQAQRMKEAPTGWSRLNEALTPD
jgi:hypothetical protein